MKCTSERYNLVERQLPTIPTPHDCRIAEIVLDDGWLVFTFDDDIARHESIKHMHPNAKALKIKYHLWEDTNIELYAYEQRKYENVFVQRKLRKLFALPLGVLKPEYILHYVTCGGIQIEISTDQSYVLNFRTDQVIFEWME